MHGLLVEAVHCGDEEDARAVLSASPKALRTVGQDGRNPMHLACSKQLTDIVELFIQYNPDINAQVRVCAYVCVYMYAYM
jgi:ankyrin repeat protein